jgi:hypothetical protein
MPKIKARFQARTKSLAPHLQDCASEIRAFVRFGGYALDKLPRVAESIFRHFRVEPGSRTDVLMNAGVPLDTLSLIKHGNEAAQAAKVDFRPPQTVNPWARPSTGRGSRPGSSAKYPRRKP